MATAELLFSSLQCPFCGNSFTFQSIPQKKLEGRVFGILSCSCYKYPVIDGIPILQKIAIGVKGHIRGNTEIVGRAPEEINSLLLQGNGMEALLNLIAFPWCPGFFKKFRILKRLTQHNPIRAIGLRLRKRALSRWVQSPPGSQSAEDWFALFYRRSLIYGDLFSYFFYRFGQPRHLAALSLMSAFPSSEKPILDLACGFGHMTHYLAECEKSHQVISVDRNFFQLWVAKYWMAPKAQYVCADADSPLPFKNAALGGVLCSDAFHLFENKTSCLDEMRRCSPDGTIILTRVGNQLVEPNEGKELSPEGYLELIQTSECRLAGESDLVKSYLLGIGPDLKDASKPEAFHREKWLSIIVTNDRRVLIDHGKFETLPHGVGFPDLNPIYRRHSRTGGSMQLSFQFPSSWFAFENEQMSAYQPTQVVLDKQALLDIRQNIRSPQIDELISQFVVLGMPQRYARK